jgi:aspartate aminotransferase-like enzyme
MPHARQTRRPVQTRLSLITPGPTPLPPAVAAALAEPLLHHRSPDFKALLGETLERLSRVFATSREVLMFAGSGTTAMESAVSNLLSAGDPVVVATAGNFGDRWAKICRSFGLDVTLVEQPWGERLDPGRIAAAAAGARAVYVTHSETSTGVVHDVRAIAEAVAPTGAMLVVDAVSSLGGVEMATDAWGIDVVVSGSQKALMAPPGLAFAAVSDRAWAASASARLPRFALDWATTRDAQRGGSTAFTPPVTLVAGLRAALRLLEEEGPDRIWANSRRLALAVREGVKALGLELFSPDDESSSMVTAVRMPEGIDGQQVYATLRDRHGIVLAGGQGPLRGKVMRIGHMGWMDGFDMITALAGLELALHEHGHRPPVPGAGAARAIELFAERP